MSSDCLLNKQINLKKNYVKITLIFDATIISSLHSNFKCKLMQLFVNCIIWPATVLCMFKTARSALVGNLTGWSHKYMSAARHTLIKAAHGRWSSTRKWHNYTKLLNETKSTHLCVGRCCLLGPIPPTMYTGARLIITYADALIAFRTFDWSEWSWNFNKIECAQLVRFALSSWKCLLVTAELRYYEIPLSSKT